MRPVDRSGIPKPHLKVRAHLIGISEKQYQAQSRLGKKLSIFLNQPSRPHWGAFRDLGNTERSHQPIPYDKGSSPAQALPPSVLPAKAPS
jgi:hypothetical protein